MSFVDHLEELRRRIFVCLGAWLLASALCYFYNDDILRFLSRPVDRLIFINPAEAFLARFKIATLSGVLLSLPILLWQAWRFVVSALTIEEKKVLFWVLPCSYALFLGGVSFCLFLVAPQTMRVLVGYGNDVLRPMLSVEAYVRFMLYFALGFGLAFQTPLVFFFLAKTGIVYPELLGIYRKQAVVVILLAAGILTPGPDILSQLALAVPLYLLYEISILVAWLAVKKF